MPEFLADPTALLPRIVSFVLFAVVLLLAVRLVKKLGVRIVEVILIVLLTAVASFFIGGWYFDRARSSKLVRGVQKAEEKIRNFFD
jgi:energy-coupling factor transporter transmembrane protein EcfT